jgi:orotate phosphoribosyltransferase
VTLTRAMPTPTLSDARARAYAIIRDRSFRFGDFTLHSGKKSAYYLDMKPTMFDPEGVGLLARMILDRLKGAEVDYVGGLEMGAVPLIAPVAMLSHQSGRDIPGFFVRKEPKDHGTRKVVEAPAGALHGKRVAILEDVTTKGDSAMKAVAATRAEGATVALVLSIVDREDGATALFEAAGIPFDSLFKASEFLAR